LSTLEKGGIEAPTTAMDQEKMMAMSPTPSAMTTSALPFSAGVAPVVPTSGPSSPRASKHVSFSAPPSSYGDHDHDHDEDIENGARTPTAVAFSPGPSRAHTPDFTTRGTDTRVNTPVPSRPSSPSPSPVVRHAPAWWTRVRPYLRTFLHGVLTPASSSILVSLLLSLVPALKALFVASPTGPHLHPAPDGLPPLSVLLDAAAFVGAASVPLGLICLGGALARLEVPRGREGWTRMPSGAIVSLAVAKEGVMPVLGVIIVQGLTRAGVIGADEKVLRFVCM
jgi:auxin efflux carrier family protein